MNVIDKYESAFHTKYGRSIAETLENAIENKAKKETVTKTMNALGESLTDKTNEALLCHNISYSTMANFRRDISLKENAKPPKKCAINRRNFKFDKESITEAVRRQQSKPVWVRLGKEYPVLQKNEKLALNGPQLLKAFAVDAGICEEKQKLPRRRRVIRKVNLKGMFL